MFEKASRLKIRFASPCGLLTVEDLWDIPLVTPSGISLDGIAKKLNRQLKESAEESFVVKSGKNDVLELQFSIIKHVINIKIAEQAVAEEGVKLKNKKQKILRIIESKKDADLEDMSLEDLEKMAAGL